MSIKILMENLSKIHIPARNINPIKTSSFTNLRPAARLSFKELKNLPEEPQIKTYLSKQINKTGKGDYEEIIYHKSGKHINYYNENDKKIKSTDIRVSAGLKKITSKTYDNSEHVIHIETENISCATGKKNIQKCDINPETNKIVKYEMIDSKNKTFVMFERDNDGTITHIINNNGDEFKCDSEISAPTVTYKNTGETKNVNYSETAGEFYSYIAPQIHIDMKRYL
ncbi:MAG: hypothetical protein SPL76_05700 [Cyanobacteriota bacterium]|nr:hypothetical protein [Cyanobacteriota bacterium]